MEAPFPQYQQNPMAGQAMVGVNMQKDPSSDDGGRDRHKGVVKYWLFDKGYGFASAENGQDYFIHHSAIQGVPAGSFRALNQGEEIEFELEYNEDRNKYMAVNVSGPGGKPPTGPVDRNAFNEHGLPNVGNHWQFGKVDSLDFSGNEQCKGMQFKQWEFDFTSKPVTFDAPVPDSAKAVLPESMPAMQPTSTGAITTDGSTLPNEKTLDSSLDSSSGPSAEASSTSNETGDSGAQLPVPPANAEVAKKLDAQSSPSAAAPAKSSSPSPAPAGAQAASNIDAADL